jgi:hypothetical protein
MAAPKRLEADQPQENRPENGTPTPSEIAVVLDLREDEMARVRRWVSHCRDKSIQVKEKEGRLSLTGISPEELWQRIGMFEVLGVTDPGLQMYLSCQATATFSTNILPPGDPKEQWDQAEHLAHALLRGITPQDPAESMLAVQMIAVHNVALDALRRATLPENNLEVRKHYMNSATKLLRLFADQTERLKKNRRSGQQKVTVEHVHVNQGGQAIVGHIEAGGPKNGENHG